MKKLLLFVFLGLFAGSVIAQDEAGKIKNEGNTALRAKNYKVAVEKYEEYLKHVDPKSDAPTVYNLAVCATKIKDNARAEKYFSLSIQNRYKTASAYVGKASAQREQNKISEMLGTLEDGMKTLPSTQAIGLEKMYANYYLSQGQDFQTKKNVAKAAESYLVVTKMKNNTFKVQGFLSLGTLYYNNGVAILEKGVAVAETDRKKYEEEKEKALAEYKKADNYLGQAATIAPTDVVVKEKRKEIKDAISKI